MRDEAGHYVYIYRGSRKAIQYVGYGRGHARATFHQVGSHNAGLDALIASGKFTVEMAGPFGSAEVGRAVEAALISALAPKLNVAKADSRWRFRPLGVPEGFAARLNKPSLRREDFLDGAAGKPIAPVLFVRINEMTFEGRVGYNPIDPPTDDQILERMDKWWMVGRFVDGWIADPERCPRTLVAVHGSPGSQIVIAAVSIDRRGWHRVETAGSIWQIPTRPTKDLDAHCPRGRRIARDARLSFGPNDNQVFLILNPDGSSLCGSPSSRQTY